MRTEVLIVLIVTTSTCIVHRIHLSLWRFIVEQCTLVSLVYSFVQCDWVEFDVQLSREEVSIIFHDFTAAMRGLTVSLYA